MILAGSELERLVARGIDGRPDGLSIVPHPTDRIRHDTSSIDLRLGRWFRTFRQSRAPVLDYAEMGSVVHTESHLTKEYFVRFGAPFVLHPDNFVLGITLEWVRLPANVAGFITGKSSWGRRGLVIETAAAIHPLYVGCLALEITNLGAVPISLRPGMPICQVVFQQVDREIKAASGVGAEPSQYAGRRKPVLGTIRLDEVAKRLAT